MALFGPLLTLLVAGLDKRFGWSPALPPVVHVIALLVMFFGMIITTWAIVSNAFFSGYVRIQEERGHQVASGGPYRYVRHPGYLGGILFNLASPFMLGTLWALVPALLTVVVVVIRTNREDKTLQLELDGYDDYSRQVSFRLLPGVW